ncbi:hypothetical protein HNQ36_005014 [Afipia massiliensis]|uniref:Uncharacterized protein n=1 Tax=Afipia massiliensis TaxID=211460 RepID=A0A840N4L8_9BRAD|nr:hypothetical protein [Afipia massiliensis]MBB5055003.1 hypothetical protein [Afipia massiliensis]
MRCLRKHWQRGTPETLIDIKESTDHSIRRTGRYANSGLKNFLGMGCLEDEKGIVSLLITGIAGSVVRDFRVVD